MKEKDIKKKPQISHCEVYFLVGERRRSACTLSWFVAWPFTKASLLHHPLLKPLSQGGLPFLCFFFFFLFPNYIFLIFHRPLSLIYVRTLICRRKLIRLVFVIDFILGPFARISQPGVVIGRHKLYMIWLSSCAFRYPVSLWNFRRLLLFQ